MITKQINKVITEVYKTIEELKVGETFSLNADDLINTIKSIKKVSKNFFEVETFCKYISMREIRIFKIHKNSLLLTEVIFDH